MEFIGDLSINDAKVLACYASNAKRVLEFGVGGSTQILAKYSPIQTVLTSIDTDIRWINKTKENMRLLNIHKEVNYICIYDTKKFDFGEDKFDLIFNDGLTSLRKKFLDRSWAHLAIGGYVLIHDTRSEGSIDIITSFIKDKMLEIDVVYCNKDDSNITVVSKKEHTPYINWRIREKNKLGYGGLE